MRELTAERLREVLHYDMQTGVFSWLKPTSRRVRCGQSAGRLNHHGYIEIGIDGRLYGAHRLAWLYVTGKFPRDMIDHVNGAKADNRFENLREADVVMNGQNRRSAANGSASGRLGVHWNSVRKAWRANIVIEGKLKTVGTFEDLDAAQAAYIEAKRQHHAGCTI